ncbi:MULTISPECIES: helix-turn-helix transcriptional regulator [Gordonibacter]|uniref:Helix-turn-helix transcriptional regulator n=1 Tax=Gordonibacter faecis TaxID=3047475 RepID=A0ABT7DN14_9ACTN|nr:MULTISPECIES: helix-turn-helix transcriptional regulator [unclassified Gordonibacter]MDJ1650929.1 helix-turn-helix transcriptional regulator [Gordonibacter sp. KGMB12511]HIW75017.1 helix-turn-helix transcriptional regulator [Candidatus Gordonibacter avicola]
MSEKAQAKAGGIAYHHCAPFVVAGFGLCWAVMYIIAYSFIFMPLDSLSSLQRDVGRIGYLAGIVVFEVVLYMLFDRLGTKRFRIPLALGAYGALALMVVTCALDGSVNAGGWPSAVAMLAAGMWQGAFHILWAEAFMYLDMKLIRRYLYLSIIIGAALFVLTALVAASAGMFIALLLAFFSLVCYVFTHQFRPEPSGHERPLTQEVARSLRKSNVVLVIYGAVFGVGIYACMAPDLPVYVSYPLTGLALALGVVGLLVVDVRSKRTLSFDTFITVLLPAVALILMVVTGVSGPMKWIMYLLLLMLLTAFDAATFCFLFELTDKLHLVPIKNITRGRIYIQAGMVAAGAIDLTLMNFFDLSRDYAFVMPFFLAVLLFVMVAASGKIDVMPRDTPGDVLKDDGLKITSADSNLAKGKVLAEEYELSRREGEVLVLLLQGYDTNSVAEKLFLSPHTVKTHTYHIYQKMGVNSRQELLKVRDER